MTVGSRRAVLLTGITLAVVTATGVAVAVTRGSGDATAGRPAPQLPTNTARVVRRDLVATATASGQLSYGDPTPLTVKATGTVTWLPAEGTLISRGQALMRVDDRPVVLLYGPIPMYRALSTGAVPSVTDVPAGAGNGSTATAGSRSAATTVGATVAPAAVAAANPHATGTAGTAGEPIRGRDVQQLESNLRALGYSGFVVDDTFSAQTARAVRSWQHDLGLPVTGAVGLGDIVYAPGPIRVAHNLVRVGAAAGGEPISYTATVKVVLVNVAARDSAWAAPGARVTVTLPTGRSLAGVVSAVGTQASVQGSGGNGNGNGSGEGAGAAGSDAQNATVPVTVALADQASVRGLESAPVDVSHVLRQRRDVLTVPVSALLALAEGGYGVQVVERGRTRIVAVTTGMFADGAVEITGGVSPGQVVGLPG